MIGLGKWKATVSSLYIKGDFEFTIADKDGQYDIDIKLPEKFSKVEISILDVKEVGSNKLTGKGKVSLLPNKELDAEFTFNGDTVEGVISLGKMGSIKVKDGKRVG